MGDSAGMLFRDMLITTKDGDWGKGEPTEGHVPTHVIRGTDFQAARLGRVSSVPLRYLPEKTVHRRTLRAGDILIETAGGSRDRPTGRTMFVTQSLLDQFQNSVTCASFARFLRVDETLANSGYIFWYLQYLYNLGAMWEHQVQHTGVARFQYTRFAETVRCPLPSRLEQDTVASLLGALDDKIAVNERIAATAVALADAKYLAVVAQVPLSEHTFGSVAEVAGGGTPSTKVEDYWGGGLSWATPSDVTALSAPYLFRTSRTITSLGLKNCASRLYPALSIFMTSRATIGDFALPQEPMAVNQGFIVVLPPTEELRWWLLHEMRSRVAEMIGISNGSTFLELSRKNFREMRIRLAADSEVKRFADVVASLHSAALRAANEIRTLTALRDTLLPKLMSGQLAVKKAESLVEDGT